MLQHKRTMNSFRNSFKPYWFLWISKC